MNTKILITGGSGFVGSSLVKKCLDVGYKVINIDLLNMEIENPNYLYVKEDILNIEKIRAYFKEVDIVIHAAAKLPLHKKKSEYKEVNIQGTKNIVKLSNDFNIKYFMYLSSSAIMGKQNTQIDEIAEPKPFEPYGISKYEGEIILKKSLNKDITYSIIRPRTVVGNERLGIFGLLFSFFQENIPVFILGNGKNTLQLIDKDELIEVIYRLLNQYIGGIYNLGNNDKTNIFNTFQNFKIKINSKSSIIKLPKKTTIFILTILDKLGLSPFAPYHYKAFGESVMFKPSKAYELVNFTPKKNNVEILVDAYESFKNSNLDTKSVSTHKKTINLKIFNILKIFKKN